MKIVYANVSLELHAKNKTKETECFMIRQQVLRLV